MSSTTLGRTSSATDVLTHLNRSKQIAFSKGDVAVVTGGNAGIGEVTVRTLALAGLQVVLCARSPEKAREVLKEFPEYIAENVDIQELDLADLTSVQRAAQQIAEKYPNIHILLNNAGVMAPPRRLETQQGIELQFGTNHVGHHYLTRLLLPNMAKKGRVVTVASEAHRYSGSVDDWQPSSYSGWSAYSRSKLANILFSKRLQELLTQDSSEIQAVSLHPGVIATNLWQYIPRIVRPLTRLIASKSVEQGAATNVYCCLAKDIQGGLYYDDCQAAQPTSLAQDAALRADLWDYTEKLLQEEGFERPNTLLRKDRDPSNALILE